MPIVYDASVKESLSTPCQVCGEGEKSLSEWQETSGRSIPCWVKWRAKEIAMIELTDNQRQELIATDAPQILDPGTGKTYVLVPTEIYERLKGLLEDDVRVTGEMVDRLLEEEDRGDPSLAFYQQNYGRKS
jgi:hypothetical protein